MTSRLKHKLELESINLKSAYLNESFVQIGTPLPELASTKRDKLEYVPEWQQEVRDEKGRRRFHGAFTGGFSAGYFNSVGSKEGWAPSEFKSSRNNRANKVQRPEDFMDEEDLQQMNEDRQLQNTDTFKNEAFAGQRKPGDTLPSALETLIAPAQTSIGQTLLQKLGWKQGQGIGPRVSLRKLRIQQGKLGRQRAGLEVEDEEMPEDAAGKHTFAPRDVRLLVYQPKDDKEGLGYEKGRGMGRLPPRATGSRIGMPDDDDDDPYAAGPSSARAFAFDHGEAEEEVFVMGGPSRSAGRDKSSGDYVQGAEQWHDGRPVIAGFALDPKGVPPDKWFEMPEIPADWRPRPARVWGTTRKWDETPDHKPEVKEVLRGAPNRPLTFEQRGAALGEEQHISKAKSVFEYMSEKDRERLAAFASAAKQSVAPPQPLSLEAEPEEVAPGLRNDEIVVPPLSPRTASAALQGFIPYGDDLARQDRYKSYLSSQTYNTKTPNPTLLQGSIEQINKELEDFAASARIFKPMSFAMSSRFTSGSASLATTDLKQPKPGLHIYDAEKAKADIEKQKAKVEAEPEVRTFSSPREEAAANGVYGPLTREVKMFYPEKLLCKRFGVQNPHPEGDPGKGEGGSGSRGGSVIDNAPLPTNDASWTDAFIHKGADVPSAGGPSKDEEEEGERRPKTIGEVGMADDVNQGRDTLSYTKPSIDIFKAIFASDDESDEEEEDPGKTTANGVKLAGPGVVSKSTVGEDPYPVKDEGPVDLQTFKPVFSVKKDEARSDKEKKKDKKDKKKRKGVLSFQVGDEGDEEEEERWKEEKKKRKKEQEKKVEGSATREGGAEDQGEWVEKPAPNPPRLAGRKGAADFM